MSSFNPYGTPSRRDWLLKAITVGVLLFSTTVAWLIVCSREAAAEASVDRGTDVIRQIRDKGLSHYWGPARQVDWYLAYDAEENVVGWQVSARRRKSNGDFQGLYVVRYKDISSRELWQINDRADEGYYEAGPLPQVPGMPTVLLTRISLKDGQVKVLHQRQKLACEAATPDNYVPKGVLELAYYVAARMGNTAGFATTFNVDADADGVMQFGHSLVKGAEEVEDGLQIVLSQQPAGGRGGSTNTLRFDKTGRRVSTESSHGKVILASRDIVASHFHDAIPEVYALLDRHDMAIEDEAEVEAMTDRGADVIAEIRKNGLDHYWGDKSAVMWYVHTLNRRVTGWRASVLRRRTGGAFEGLDMHSDGRWEYWTLDNGATRGRYEAGLWKHVVGSAHLERTIDTKISLAEGRVKLWQKDHGVSEAPVPENYVPEGLLDLTYRLTAGRKTKAQFAVVFNVQAPDNGVTQFGRTRVDKVEAVEDRLQVTVRTGGIRWARRMQFDNTGRLVHWAIEARGSKGPMKSEGQVVQEATVVRAGKGYDQAPAYVKDLLEQIATSGRDDPEGGDGTTKPGADGVDKTDGTSAGADR